jgi:hypothetical protein
VRAQRPEFANQAGVLRREECRIHKLLHLVREPDVILWHVRPIRLGRNGQGHPCRALGTEARGQHSLRQQQENGVGWFDSSGLLSPLEPSRSGFSHFSIDGVSVGRASHRPCRRDEKLHPSAGVSVLCEESVEPAGTCSFSAHQAGITSPCTQVDRVA